ncbi:MAG: hypothetical protein LBQ73_09475 [Tannerellaceae bacterium]|nr:hypothetical protein [Tannerellaceae bacterium]
MRTSSPGGVREVFYTNVIKASEILNTDKGFRKKVADAQEKLPALKTGKYGQLQDNKLYLIPALPALVG